jgi:sterol desaturase/sphingolipid hydroxylase (fatty acid hydroxylase superfamily)
MFSSIFGCMIMGSHVTVLWLWLSIRITEAVNSHSGYHFLPYWISDFFSGGEFHEYHHSHNIGNYGAFTTFWDKLMGTETSYQQYRIEKKDKDLHKIEKKIA